MKKLVFVFEKMESGAYVLAKIAAFIMMLLTSADAAMRYVVHKPIIGAYEFSESYLMVILIFLSMSYVMKEKGHIRIDIFTDKMPKKFVEFLDKIYLLLAAALMFAIGYQGLVMTEEALINNYVSAGLIKWPTWASVIWVPIGAFLFTLRLLVNFVQSLMPSKESEYEQRDRNIS
ncbi:TRAP transporter small permease [Neobacillus sp. MM2021_6]|uniref:TRAP transporter small permease n=1 Tax=Bacillaceae TaxID=186817 RepID=UPI0014092C6C|nr:MULTISPECIES: TRAP transporter small permease [Bacillaceae]MBO0959989.1 TRAP transporter small permease [Neobacillus sp. MM2021_6]NHC18689.1 TRAP transporter small permease [Bacillus sp. MM2020_4]